MYNKNNIRRQVDMLVLFEREWQDHLSKQDSGNAWERASQEYIRSLEIRKAITSTIELLRAYQV